MSTEMVALTDFSYENTGVRVLGTKLEPWFVCRDVFEILEIPINYMARTLKKLDDDEKGVIKLMTPGGQQEAWIVSEPGLYKIMLRSRTPKAEAFTRFVTHEVLPSIRKYGCYKPPRKQYELPSGTSKGSLALMASTLGMRLTDAEKMKEQDLKMFCEERRNTEWVEANKENYPYSFAELDAEVGGYLNLILLYVKGLEKYAMNERGAKGQESFRFTQEFKDNLPVFAKKARVEIRCRA